MILAARGKSHLAQERSFRTRSSFAKLTESLRIRLRFAASIWHEMPRSCPQSTFTTDC